MLMCFLTDFFITMTLLSIGSPFSCYFILYSQHVLMKMGAFEFWKPNAIERGFIVSSHDHLCHLLFYAFSVWMGIMILL